LSLKISNSGCQW